ncbi:uncharacterized protein LOC144439911 [Glandiceps talaboti]
MLGALQFVAFSLSLISISASDPPSITRHPSSTSRNEGTSSVTLSCQADGVPTPTITWAKDSRNLQTNSKYTVTGGSLVIHNIDRSDDGQYRCVAASAFGEAISNPATLTVHYPPGEPTCTRSPSRSYYLTNTGTVTLTCEAVDGKPVATVQWYKNEESSPLSPTQSVNGNTIERTYALAIGKSDNTATYTCKVINTVLSNPLECELTFTVYFPPTYVIISGYSTPRKEDETLTLTCTTGSSNPAAEISWYKNDGSWTSGNGESTNTVQDSNGAHNGIERTQELDIILQPRHNGARYQCKARNSYYSTNQVQSAIKEITVYFKPSSVTLTGYTNPVKSGDTLILVCQTESSNPHADISWFKNGVSLTSSTTETIKTSTTSWSDNGGEKTRQELHITLSQSHNGIQFQCHGRNSRFPMNTKVESANQGINVYFPPLQVSLSADKSNPVQEDMTLTMTCTTESSNPVATISWYKNGVLWSPSDGETLRSAEQSNGLNGGKVTTQQLDITLTPYHNQDIFTCKGRNDQFSDDVVESDEIQLNVHYVPFVLNEKENSQSTADEGEPATMICEVDSNPDATITWYKNGNEVDINDKFSILQTNSGTQFRSTLSLTKTERFDHGNYTCKAENDKGIANFIVALQGKSGPDAPKNIEISRSYTSLTIEIIPGFDGGEPESIMYYVEYHNSTHEDWQPWPSNGQGSRNTQITITDLTDNTTYVLKARAENKLGIGPYSNEYTFKTYGMPVVTLDVNSGTLSWTLHEDPDVLCIQVEVLSVSDDWVVENECVNATITEYTVTDKSATYRIVYCTLSGECEQSEFDAAKVSTPDDNSSSAGIITGTIFAVAAVVVIGVVVFVYLKRRKVGDRHIQQIERRDVLIGGRGCICAVTALTNTVTGLDEQPYEVTQLAVLAGNNNADSPYVNIPGGQENRVVRGGDVNLTAQSGNSPYTDLIKASMEGEKTYMKLVELALEFPRYRLKIKTNIHHGDHHVISKGTALHIGSVNGFTDVAIKMCDEDADENEEQDIMKEIELLKSLPTHPNIINILGCIKQTSPVSLIMPYFSNGNMTEFLEDNYEHFESGTGTLTEVQLLSFISDVINGMEHLSDNKVVHRYLAAKHVMVESSLTCKISQFGYASKVITAERFFQKAKDNIPYEWMAPESVLRKQFTTESDVWSFGVVLWEIVSLGATPYEGMSVASRVSRGYTLTTPLQCGPRLEEIVRACMNKKPAKRPTFKMLNDTMKPSVNNIKDYINLQRLGESPYGNVNSTTYT